MAFQPRLKADGTPCCFRINEYGGLAFPAGACQPCKDFAAARSRAAVLRTAQEGRVTFPKRTCQRCRDAAHDGNSGTAKSLRTTEHQEDTMTNDYTPPNPYGDLATLRAASATPESAFEDRWKADRLQALDAERTRRDAANAAAPRLKTLTAEELAPYAPPDPYRVGIEDLQARDTRARIIREGR